jgi:hypothetical protein
MRFITNGNRVELFVPIAKFDQRTGEFEAWATVEELDGHNEICDVEKSWPALVAAAEAQAEISKGKSIGNLRRQHRRDTAVGKLTKMERRDHDGRDAVWVEGKVTDEKAKADIVDGVLTGISYRGLAKRWADETIKGAKRYAWDLVEETSVVDRPAVPHALIEVIKADGRVEMVKARGREVSQFWDCGTESCATKHTRKEQAAACDGLPMSIEASKGEEIETEVLLDKCLDCVAGVAYLIQRVTLARPAKTCPHITAEAGCGCGHGCYSDPGHEEMEAGVKQLYDALRAMVADMRAKWLSDEGIEDPDALKTLDALRAKLLDSYEVFKSLRVPSGNGSNNSLKEGTMEDTKPKAPETAAAATPPVDLAKAFGDKLDAIATDISEVKKSLGKVEELEKSLDELGKVVEELASYVGKLPAAPKGQLRAVKKEDETAEAQKSKDDAETDPFKTAPRVF